MNLEAIDRALGRGGLQQGPLETGMTPAERDRVLESSLCFPDRQLPTGELADWAAVLIELEKEVVVRVAVAAVEAAQTVLPIGSGDSEFVSTVLGELHSWLDGPKGIGELERLGNLWWSTVRNPPRAAQTPLGDATFMAWWVTAYDPEGWGDPPDNPDELQDWLSDAANNKGGIVDVFSVLQQGVDSEQHTVLVDAVRQAVGAWRDSTA